MKKYNTLFFVLSALLLFSCNGNTQTTAVLQNGSVEVIQFHNEHRCYSCLQIEKLTKATLAKNFPAIPFKLVNLDDKNNTPVAKQFEAAGTALFLYNAKTGKKKNLTAFAFMKVGNEAAYTEELMKYIDAFLKG
ncbi:MAG: hypothetical protein IPH18_07080 [Chitinophagaceae bacterium]|nr:hypothetical protein [Chitinophagaceae bacterium]